MSESKKNLNFEIEDEFGAFEGSAKSSAEFFRAGVLYFVVLKKPQEVEVDSDFKDWKGNTRKVKNYKIEILDVETGQFITITTYAKLYLDMIAKFDELKVQGLAPMKYKELSLFPYVRSK